jgi:DNA-binding NarL/FixJ family response regulator
METHRPSIRVLIVDDFEPWRRSVCSILRGNGEFQVVGEAADGWEAVQKAQTLKPDLIVLDLGLPKLNGLEAANRIHQVAHGAKIIFLTQMSDKETVQAALTNGAQGYVLKEDAGSELLPAIKSVLGGEKFVSSRIKWQDCSGAE